jgi:hypothetical protein
VLQQGQVFWCPTSSLCCVCRWDVTVEPRWGGKGPSSGSNTAWWSLGRCFTPLTLGFLHFIGCPRLLPYAAFLRGLARWFFGGVAGWSSAMCASLQLPSPQRSCRRGAQVNSWLSTKSALGLQGQPRTCCCCSALHAATGFCSSFWALSFFYPCSSLSCMHRCILAD